MDYAKESLRLHGEWGGKIEVVCTVPCKTKEDLSLAYTPGVAQPCLVIVSFRVCAVDRVNFLIVVVGCRDTACVDDQAPPSVAFSRKST